MVDYPLLCLIRKHRLKRIGKSRIIRIPGSIRPRPEHIDPAPGVFHIWMRRCSALRDQLHALHGHVRREVEELAADIRLERICGTKPSVEAV